MHRLISSFEPGPLCLELTKNTTRNGFIEGSHEQEISLKKIIRACTEVSVVTCRYRKNSVFVLVKPTRLYRI